VFEYGFTFFIEAMNEHQIISNEKRKDLAIAMRVASRANEKGWKQFLKRK
jgi:hypothetical protein